MDQLVKLKNHVPEKQRFFQNDPRPVYFRSPRSNLYLSLWYTGLGVGLLGITYGATQLIKALSPGLQRARAPFRVRNAITGLLVGTFAVSVWAYSIRAVKQDTFEDVDEEAKAMLSSRAQQQEQLSNGETSTSASNLKVHATAATAVAVESSTKSSSPSLPNPRTTIGPAGVLAPLLDGRYPRFLDPERRTFVWGAPPVDRIGRLSDRNV
ncbi:hypothetical protein SCHPADRAFT_848183 [Schizopora paradoxa]|uniref:Cytochrome c oxidase assembly factor 3 n=1 Tax=Schizopora paradoxa TaxID=27342 RepID=A0A0H2S3I8_9AGAM|nr:hypothetical protein SCHPADRAFT_848183 [Schizopora paradoxa]